MVYPDGGLPGASRLVLILMVVYLEEGGQSGSLRWCTWKKEASLDSRGGLPGRRRMVSTLMVAYPEQAGWS
jgi:hypothetical protein